MAQFTTGLHYALVFCTAGFFATNEWLNLIRFTSTSRAQRSLLHHTTFHWHSIFCNESLKSEEGVEGYGGLEGLQGCEGLVLGIGLRSGAWSCMLVQHPRVSVQVAVH